MHPKAVEKEDPASESKPKSAEQVDALSQSAQRLIENIMGALSEALAAPGGADQGGAAASGSMPAGQRARTAGEGLVAVEKDGSSTPDEKALSGRTDAVGDRRAGVKKRPAAGDGSEQSASQGSPKKPVIPASPSVGATPPG
jgi:hypothetical protein